ncbi:DUF4153 domain-containing protein [Phytohabitans kaempferiae]|uniref:DUF4153 domain-containing protein n=1 Tax=Phytohabitans kaempferiae TaxID=1620943 RepID=A0ABV6ME36_9ACTN
MSERRVLVVEDERTIADSVAARLRAEGFTVRIAADGPSAVEIAGQMRPDLVVLDVMLPGFDGLEVCRRIQAERPVPVLMLTARDDETDLLVGLAVGADDYLTKPFSMRDRLLVRVLLGGLAALCLVIVASALFRMHTYEEAYGFTRLRLLVSACVLWLGSVLVMVLVAGVRLRAGWLPQAAVGSGVAALVGLALLDPDHFIADRNVHRYEQTGRIDVAYLAELSADAVPALDRLPATLRTCALGDVARDLGQESDWRAWNLGTDRARHALGDHPDTSYPWSEACGPRRTAW